MSGPPVKEQRTCRRDDFEGLARPQDYIYIGGKNGWPRGAYRESRGEEYIPLMTISKVISAANKQRAKKGVNAFVEVMRLQTAEPVMFEHLPDVKLHSLGHNLTI
jgi:hypothetical protein